MPYRNKPQGNPPPRHNKDLAIAIRTFSRIILAASLAITIQSGPAAGQDQCLNSISEVRQDIEGRVGAVVGDIKSISLEEWKGDNEYATTIRSPFSNASHIVVFYLVSDMGRDRAVTRQQAQAAENIMSSSLLTRSYADKIIKACEPGASVKFYYWEWFQGWSLHDGNILKEDQCKSPRGDQLYWGDNICL